MQPETLAQIEVGEDIGVSWDDISDPDTNVGGLTKAR